MRKRLSAPAAAAMLLALCGCPRPPAAPPAPSPSRAVGDTRATSLDWPGTYAGVVPCADCEGIDTSITLSRDLGYTVRTRYLGKESGAFERTGTFSWNEEGNTIRLEGMENAPDRYLVGENALFQLDRQGKRIAGALADRYVLRKVAALPQAIFGSSWRLSLHRARMAPLARFQAEDLKRVPVR